MLELWRRDCCLLVDPLYLMLEWRIFDDGSISKSTSSQVLDHEETCYFLVFEDAEIPVNHHTRRRHDGFSVRVGRVG